MSFAASVAVSALFALSALSVDANAAGNAAPSIGAASAWGLVSVGALAVAWRALATRA